MIISCAEDVAKKRGVSMAIAGIAWVLRQGRCPIVGLNSSQRIIEAVKAVEFRLTDEEVLCLEELYVPKRVTGH
jgi:aryl-alcohol dehydrogenase-like predicted oxidoreductase